MRLPFLRRPTPHLPAVRDFPFVELVGADTRVVVVPSLGGKIGELWLGGRQWLWHSPVIPHAPGVEGESYVETADSGGVDECFPTVGACRVPGWVRGVGGIELPDHGELWSQAPDMDVRTSKTGQIARCSWVGKRMPYRIDRAVRVDHEGVVHVSYAVINDGRERMPFVWATHPLFALTERTRVRLPDGARLRVYAQHGIDLGEPRSEHRWPFVRGGGKVHDFSVPHDVARRYACKLFIDMEEGEAALCEGDLELRIAWDPVQIPHVGLWINKRGWTPFRDQPACMNVSLQPAIGAPDTLVDALGDWKAAAWLDPEETRRWSFRLTAGPTVLLPAGEGEPRSG